MQLTPARVATLLGAASAFLAGLAPAVANLDTRSTAGVLAGGAAVLVYVATFLKGQRAHEARVANARPALFTATPGAMTSSAGFHIVPTGLTPDDDGNDGDDVLPVELEGHRHSVPPPDDIDEPDAKVGA